MLNTSPPPPLSVVMHTNELNAGGGGWEENSARLGVGTLFLAFIFSFRSTCSFPHNNIPAPSPRPRPKEKVIEALGIAQAWPGCPRVNGYSSEAVR